MGKRSMTVALALALAVLAAGCGDDDDPADLATSTPSAVPTGFGEPDGGSSPSIAGRVKATPGLPAGFPAEVPIIEGESVEGALVDPSSGSGWTVTVRSGEAPAAVSREVAASLGRAAGEPDLEIPVGQDTEVDLGGYRIVVRIDRAAAGSEISYTVTPAG